MEQAHGVRAAADAGDQRIRQPAFKSQYLLARLVADHALEIAHHHRIGMRAGDGADAIERVGNIGDPVAQRLVHGVFSVFEPNFDRHTLAPSAFMRSTFGCCRATSTEPM